MQTGQRVEYDTRARTLTATVRDVSQDGKIVKILKRTRTHWVTAAELKQPTNDDQTTERTTTESELDSSPRRENNRAEIKSSTVDGPRPETGAKAEETKRPSRPNRADEQENQTAPAPLQRESIGVETGEGMRRGSSPRRQRESALPTRAARVRGQPSFPRPGWDAPHGPEGMDAGMQKTSSMDRREPKPRARTRTPRTGLGMEKTIRSGRIPRNQRRIKRTDLSLRRESLRAQRRNEYIDAYTRFRKAFPRIGDEYAPDPRTFRLTEREASECRKFVDRELARVWPL
jgi:hypothetical protein